MVSSVSTTCRHARMAQALNRYLSFSQEDIAHAVGCAYTTVHGWVKGASSPNRTSKAAIEAAFTGAVRRSRANGNELSAVCALMHVEHGTPVLGGRDAVDELFFILCSLKTSHHTYEAAFQVLADEFSPWEELLEVTPEAVEEIIRKKGLGSLKARGFVMIAKKLKDDFGSVTLNPLKSYSASDAERYLMSLPGVGITTARSVMLYALGHDVIPADSHTYRVAVRLGLIPTSKNPDAAHKNLDKISLPGYNHALHSNFQRHGQEICLEAKPKCELCVVRSNCPSSRKNEGQDIVASAIDNKARLGRIDSKPVAIDLYAGCGGLSLGLEQAGFNVGYVLDWDKHACATHALNFPDATVDCADVREVSHEKILAAVGGRVDLVAGGPNCQGVSQRGLRSPDDPRNFMFPEFLRIVEGIRPRMFLMENVPGLAHRHNYAMLKEIFESFERLGYRCGADVLLAADYGVPQLRYRFFMVGTLGDEPLGIPAPTHVAGAPAIFARPFITIREAIGDLPSTKAGVKDQGLGYTSDSESDYQKLMREGSQSIYDHHVSATEELNLRRASYVPEGGNWKNIPPELLPPRFFQCRLTDHSTTYARPRWDMPSFTVTSLLGNITAGAFTHPSQNRAFSVREGARLQSFPDRFHFAGPINSKYRQIGNAVPPLLAQALGSYLLAVLRGERPAARPMRIDSKILADMRAWEALPVLTPRFKALFGAGTRWPIGWGPEPVDRSAVLDSNYRLREEFYPVSAKEKVETV